MDCAERFLQGAVNIGRRICADAIWRQGTCTWLAVTPDRSGYSYTYQPCDSSLYRGAAGIALFLGELHRAAPDERFARSARAAVHSAGSVMLSGDAHLPGFHTGTCGVAFVAWRLADITGSPELLEMARRLLDRAKRQVAQDWFLDVIAGAAGAIPALLLLRHTSGFEDAYDLAIAMGDRLLAQADRFPWGWSWCLPDACRRGLTGYAHGASGVAVALYELAAVTGDAKYHYGGTQAIAYERHYFDPVTSTWADFRVGELSELLHASKESELRERVRTGERIDWAAKPVMRAWCHGATGIGLARLRAWELFGDPRDLHEGRLAVEVVRPTVRPGEMPNYSLCHGVAGNCDMLLLAAEVLCEDALRAEVLGVLSSDLDRYDDGRASFPSGATSQAPDPTLMLGDAGVGLTMLRAAGVAVTSPLQVRPPTPSRGTLVAPGHTELALRDAERHLPYSLRIMQDHVADGAAEVSRALSALAVAPTMGLRQAIRTRMRDELDPLVREMLESACLIEDACLDLLAIDWDRVLLEQLAHESMDDVAWDSCPWTLSVRARVVQTDWDWGVGSSVPARNCAPTRLSRPREVLICREEASVTMRLLGDFAGAVLGALQAPRKLADLIPVVHAASGSDAGVPGGFAALVRQQLQSAHRAGIAVRAWSAMDA